MHGLWTTEYIVQVIICTILIIAFWIALAIKPKRFHTISECHRAFFNIRKAIMSGKGEPGSYEAMIEEFANEFRNKETHGIAKDYELELRQILEDMQEDTLYVV